MPRCDTEAMQAHLVEIGTMVAPNAHAVLILDKAGWHLSGSLDVPANISLLPLPPRSPELTPVENVWQFLRDNWLSNRVFKSYDDIVAHCCEAWNELMDQPWRTKSIGRREWAHGFRSIRVGIRPSAQFDRGGLVCLNNFLPAVKWLTALFTPPPGLASVG